MYRLPCKKLGNITKYSLSASVCGNTFPSPLIRSIPDTLQVQRHYSQNSSQLPRPARYAIAFVGGVFVYSFTKPLIWWPLAAGLGVMTYRALRNALGLNYWSIDSLERRTREEMRRQMGPLGAMLQQAMRQAMKPMADAQKLGRLVQVLTVELLKAETRDARADANLAHFLGLPRLGEIKPVGPVVPYSIQQIVVNGVRQTVIGVQFHAVTASISFNVMAEAVETDRGIEIKSVKLENEDGEQIDWKALREMSGDIPRSKRSRPPPGVIDVDWKEVKRP